MESRTYKIERLLSDLRRQYPVWPSTFGTCECKRRAGRGGGACSECIEERLAELIGKPLAWEIHRTIAQLQMLELAALEEKDCGGAQHASA